MRNEPTSERLERAHVIYRYFRKDLRKRRGKIAAGAAFAVVYAVARAAEPWPLKVVFDQVLFAKRAHGILLQPFLILGHSRYEILAASGAFLAVAAVIRGVAYYYEDYLLSSAAQEIVYGVRSRLYRQLHRLPLSFHQNRPTGDLLVRLSSDIILLRDVLIDATVNVGTGIVLLILMLAIMLIVDPILTAVAVCVMPLIAVLAAMYGRRIRANANKQRKQEGRVAAVMHEALAAIDVVQLHGAGEREQARFAEINRRSLKHGNRTVRLEARMNRGVELALAAGTVVVLWFGTVRALHGVVTPGDLVVFISYLRAAYRPLRRISKTVQRSAKALAAAERIVEVLETEPELRDAPDAQPAPALAGTIEFERVSFAYNGDALALQDVSFTAKPGQLVAIVGESGSGKSTLVSLVPRLYDATAGHVKLDGGDVRDFTLESVREQISVVRQESVLFGLSIAENIRYGRPDASDEEVQGAAAAAGLDDFVAALPDGYDTVVSERGASLSGGQRQRVALARALIRRTPILILDEPTTGLDAATETAVLRAIGRLDPRPTILMVTHDIRLVEDADQILVLDRGCVGGRGTFDTLLAESPGFRALADVAGLQDEPSATARQPGSSSSAGPRVLFYSHNGVGVGHLQRQLDLAKAYRGRHPDAAVLLASGSHAASMFELPPGVDLVKLPSLVMTDRYRTWAPRGLTLPLGDVVELRRQLLRQAVDQFAPDLLVADFMPAGPYGELLPALEELGRRGGRAVAGFRDVVDEPSFVRELWLETGVYEALRAHYAAICVYGDPAMLDFAGAYGLDGALAERVEYCGYIGRSLERANDVPAFERPLVIGTCGGGADGAKLVETFIEAAAELAPELGGTWLAVSGPLLAYDEHIRLARLGKQSGVAVSRIVPNLRAHIALADCVVAMPGYNTVCDLASYRRRAVLVPRAGPSHEQRIRSERLREWGFGELVPFPELESGRLAEAVERALAAPPPSVSIPLRGAELAVDVYDRVIDQARVAVPTRAHA
jgi:ATP-binding cassette subfamily B protein